MQHSRVYNQQRELLGFLENATCQYTLKGVPLHTATFTLPVDDPANAICQVYNLVEIFDSDERVELFRIIEVPDAVYSRKGGNTVTYKCEHVFATLIDEVMPEYHEVGGWGGDGHNLYDTAGCINYALSFQQEKHWVLKRCDFTRHFQYSWEDETVLRAVLSIPNRIETDYMFTFDTTVYPWEFSLIQLDTKTNCELRYSRNLQEIRKKVDAKNLVTRLYPRGYGEGVNKLNIAEVNDGIKYLDADTQSIWGVKSKIWTDARFELAQSLKERGLAILDELKTPYISYTVKAIDLYRLTKEPFDRFMPGNMVRVIDDEYGIVFTARVVEVTKPDPRGKPADITVTIANKPQNVADTIAELASRASIHELYAIGATTTNTTNFADNADADKPATFSEYIPGESVRINKMILRWQLAPFRSYSKGADAGGGTTFSSSAGGGSTATSSAGGGSTATSATSGGGVISSGPSNKETVSISNTWTRGQDINFTKNEENTLYTNSISSTATSSVSGSTSTVNGSTGSAGIAANASTGSTGGPSSTYTGNTTVTGIGSQHNHSMQSHTHSLNGHTHSINSHSHSYSHSHTVSSHSHTHDHYHYLASHRHQMAHQHDIEHSHDISHTHSVSLLAHTHNVSIPEHTHSVVIPEHTHAITLPNHNHMLIAGIFEGKSVSKVQIEVDGVLVPDEDIDGNELDIVKYLGKDDAGKIRRNAWHEIRIIPIPTEYNTEGQTRVVASLFTQSFVRSQGGGDY